MTNLIDNTETTGWRLAGPAALVLLAAGGMTAAIARSSENAEQSGLAMSPLTAQAQVAGSPAPEVSPTPAAAPFTAPEAASDPVQQAESRPVTTPAAPTPTVAVEPNRFAESFAGVEAPLQSLALDTPEPAATVAIQAPVAAPAAPVAEIVPEASAQALQLVAVEPVATAPSATPAEASPVPLVAMAVAPVAEPAVPESQAKLVATAELAIATPIAVEAVAPIETISAAPAEPASVELVPQPIAAPQAEGPIARALAEPLVPAASVTFVSKPLVQPLPVSAAPKPIEAAPAAVTAQPVRLAVKPAPAIRPGKTKRPRGAQPGGLIASNFQLTDGMIDYKIGARVNGGDPRSLPLRITRDDQLSVKLGDLLALVKPEMDPALYAYLSASRGAEEYVSFAAIRATGIDIRYDAAHDQLMLGVE